MKKILFFTIIGAMLAWAVYDFAFTGDSSSDSQNNSATETAVSGEAADTGLAVGKTAPDFKLKTMDGEEMSLSDFRGQPVFVNFWATWCPPCRAEMPDMEKLYGNMDIEILAVNMTDTEKNAGAVADFVDETALTFPILMDVDGELSSVYNVRAYPTSYLIGADGKIGFIAYGAMNYDHMVQEFEKMK